jgi:hypothetical protein
MPRRAREARPAGPHCLGARSSLTVSRRATAAPSGRARPRATGTEAGNPRHRPSGRAPARRIAAVSALRRARSWAPPGRWQVGLILGLAVPLIIAAGFALWTPQNHAGPEPLCSRHICAPTLKSHLDQFTKPDGNALLFVPGRGGCHLDNKHFADSYLRHFAGSTDVSCRGWPRIQSRHHSTRSSPAGKRPPVRVGPAPTRYRRCEGVRPAHRLARNGIPAAVCAG